MRRHLAATPRRAVVCGVIAAAVLLAGCGSGGGSTAPSSHAARFVVKRGHPPFRFFSPNSFWNREVSPTAELDPRSAELTGALAQLVSAEYTQHEGPAINTSKWGVPIYTVPADRQTVRVTLDTPDAPALQAAFDHVPMPPHAEPAKGTDRRLVVWQPSTEKLWEFWRASHQADGWHADWGGAIQHVTKASGLPTPTSWPGAEPFWGGSGASMGMVGGTITLEDLHRGVINHALSIALPNVRAGVFAAPALRTDGKSTDPTSLPEGAHLRLDPNLDLSQLRMPYMVRLMAQAAQRYGIFVINGAADVSFAAEDPTRTGKDPYHGAGGYFEGSHPREMLASFPWQSLQLLKMDLHQAR